MSHWLPLKGHRVKEENNFREIVSAEMLRDLQGECSLSNGDIRRLWNVSRSRVYRARIPEAHSGHQPMTKLRFFDIAEKAGFLDVAKKIWKIRALYRRIRLVESF